MPPARKSKSVAIEASAPSEKTKTRTRRKNAPTPKTPKNNDAPSQLVEEGPTATPTSPKKRGRKPKRVAAKADDLPTQNMAEALGTKTADEPTGDPHIGSNLKSKKAPVPARDPLPDRGVRNTHPGVYFGLQPTPRRRPHQVAAAREKKRQELEAQIQAADAIKEKLARMDLEDERAEEALREQGRRRLQFGQNDESSGDEDFDLDGVDTDEKDTDKENTDEEDTDEEDSPSPEPDKEVRTHSPNDLRLTTYHQTRSKVKVKAKVRLEKLSREHCARISMKRGNGCAWRKRKKVRQIEGKQGEVASLSMGMLSMEIFGKVFWFLMLLCQVQLLTRRPRPEEI